jgi:glyoxylate reductase/D-3-phosphoglycerate dehydrogenase
VRFRLLPEILRDSDILSLHVPLNESTRGMIGAGELAVKPSAIIVNTSRGPVIDEKALTAHLAGPTFESNITRLRDGFDNVQRVARGEPALWVVPELLA